MTKCLLCSDLKNDPTLIKNYGLWRILIDFKQPTLGSCLIVPHRHIEIISKLTGEEQQEYLLVIKNLDNTLRKSFNPDNINYLMLAMKVPHIHWHVVPRYQHPKEFNRIIWTDPNYGSLPIFPKEKKYSKILEDIIEKIRENL